MKQKWPADHKKHLNPELVEAKKEAKADIRRLLETGDETALVQLAKLHNPQITPDELLALLSQFREERLRRAGFGARKRP